LPCLALPLAGGRKAATLPTRARANLLHQRITGAIAAFLAAFDSPYDESTAAVHDRLIEATDTLMRATARTRVELERLRNEAERTRGSGERA
jgi:hypothetical protein